MADFLEREGFYRIVNKLSFSYAANEGQNMVNDVRNAVGGAENAVENAGKDVVNGVKDGMNAIGNGSKDVTNNVGGTVQNTMNPNNNNSYTATRTSADNNGTFMGMSGTMWTWLILAIAAIAIISLVMLYAKQHNEINPYNDNNKF